MKVCGFTFIRNAEKFDFPVVEAITSVLPLCDRFVVAVGDSEDKTRQIIKKIPSPKITVIDTVWDSSLRKGGMVYAAETDKAFRAIPQEYDWCFYIQGDEVMHEQFLPAVRQAMKENLEREDVEGLLFRFRHFFGTYDYVGDSRKWYRREIRVIRNDKSIYSYRDAQGFRKQGRKLRVVPVDAEIYHYGWVRSPKFMQAKINSVRQFYEGISEEQAHKQVEEQVFHYGDNYDALVRFQGTHPAVMQERIGRLNWNARVKPGTKRMNLRYRLLYYFEKMTGIRPFEYRNYRLLKRRRRLSLLS